MRNALVRVIAFIGLWVSQSLFFVNLCLAQSGLSSPVPIGPYLNSTFPASLTEVSSDDVSYSQRNYFPTVSFTEPIRIVEHPNRREILVVSKDGLGHLITNSEGSSDKRRFFDIRPIMHGNPSGEGGISDLVFHPRFEQSGQTGHNEVFISYWWSPDNSGTVSDDNGFDGYNRVSRFSVVNNTVDLSTEEVLINQYDREMWHIGMDMEFGNDGFLYIAAADETPTDCCNFADSTQSLSGGLWSGVLRIDVDNDPARSHPIRRQPVHPTANPRDNGNHWPESFSQGYSIPDDNPFLATDGSRLEEFFSLGLRHPWTMSIDKATGQVWVADVGRREREEVNLVEKGDNHQWPYRQGTLPGPVDKPASVIGNEKPPTWEYQHIPNGNAVIGAGVYRGTLFPELVGKYLFSDFVRGDFWALTSHSQSGVSVEKIGDLTNRYGNGINSYLLDSNGRILLSRTNGALRDGGTVDLLVRSGGTTTASVLPDTLNATNAFTDLNSLEATPGCIDYELNVPFWSDGAEKYRWLCLPNDGTHNTAAETIVFSETDPWSFPAGTVFIKHFEAERTEGNSSTAFPLETRFLVITEDSHYGVTYRWNSSGTEASLVSEDGDRLSFTQQTSTGSVTRNWDFPSRRQCIQCHSDESGGALGVNTRQLNRFHRYESTSVDANQLVTFDQLNMFSGNINATGLIGNVLTSTPTDNNTASVEDRARSYLDSNCAYCHNPSGVRANFDARLSTPLDNTGLVNGSLIENYGIDGAAVITPGSLEKSIAYSRAASLGNLQMPPIGKNVVDAVGIDILEQWILSLAGTDDSDDDGIPDDTDNFPLDPDNDIDGDNISGHIDNCPEDFNPDQSDSNGDGIGDGCSIVEDSDDDGIPDDTDTFPLDPDNDIDGDNISGHIDNCPVNFNPDQSDSDGDGVGDECSVDDDTAMEPDFSVQIADHRFGVCVEVAEADLQVGANVHTSTCSTAPEPHQLFDFTLAADDTYTIRAHHSGLCLTVEGDSAENSASILQDTCRDNLSQLFTLTLDGDRYAITTNTGDGTKVLDASADLDSDGVTRDLAQWGDRGVGNQRWSLISDPADLPTIVVDDSPTNEPDDNPTDGSPDNEPGDTPVDDGNNNPSAEESSTGSISVLYLLLLWVLLAINLLSNPIQRRKFLSNTR